MRKLPVLIAIVLFVAVSGLVALLVALTLRHRHGIPREAMRELEAAFREHPGIRLKKIDPLDRDQAWAEHRRANPEASIPPCGGVTVLCSYDPLDPSEMMRFRVRLRENRKLQKLITITSGACSWRAKEEYDPLEQFEFQMIRTCPETAAPALGSAR